MPRTLFFVVSAVMFLLSSSLILKQSTTRKLPARSFCSSLSRLNLFKPDGGELRIPSILNDNTDGTNADGNPVGPKKTVFEDHVTFPTLFTIKVIGVNDPTFVTETVNNIAALVKQDPSQIKVSTKEAAGGKYLSISLSPMFKDAEEVYAAYDIVSKDSRVKFVI